MKKKRKPSPLAEMRALLKALEKLPREEAAELTAPLVGTLLKALLKSARNQNLQPESRRDAAQMIKRAQVWFTHLRDEGLAPEDLARMYGIPEQELRAFLAGEPLKDERH